MRCCGPTVSAADDRLLLRAMNASFVVSVVLLGVKITAAALTGSSAIYSDAAESVVNVLAAGFASYSLRLSRKPADRDHHYGHEKASFLSAGFEGAMITVAACFILYDSIHKLAVGGGVERTGLGLGLTLAATAVNCLLGLMLVRTGRRARSLVLEANGQHILTDVWTSAGVVAGLVLVMITGQTVWDPLAAILVATNILFTGWSSVRRSLGGLMDEADPAVEESIRGLLGREAAARGLGFHQLRYRHTGRTHWVEFHLLFRDGTPIDEAHAIATEIESGLNDLLSPSARIITHLEPLSAAAKVEEWER